MKRIHYLSSIVLWIYCTGSFADRCVTIPPFEVKFSAGAKDILGFALHINLYNLGTESQKISAELSSNTLRFSWMRSDGKSYFDPPLNSAPSIIPSLGVTSVGSTYNLNPGTNATITLPTQKNGSLVFTVYCSINWNSAATCTPSWTTVLTYTGIGVTQLINSGISGGVSAKICVQEDRGAVIGSALAHYSSDNNANSSDQSLTFQLNGGRPF